MPKNLFLPQTSLRHFDAYSMLRVPPPPEVAPRPEEFDVEMNKLCWSHFTPTTTIHEYFALLPGFRLSPVKIFPSLSLSPCSYEFECSQSAFRLFVSFDFSFSFVPFDSVPCESCKKSSFISPFRRPAPALVEPKST